MTISFIGMSGAGKSYVGSRFAAAHAMVFVDIDREMEAKYGGTPLQEILEELGEERFLKEQEEQVLALVEARRGVEEGLVVSPGGSVVYTPGAMETLKKLGKVVYLQVPLAVIKERIAEEPRGIVGLGAKTFDELYEERTALYEKWADIVIDAQNKTPEEIIIELQQL